MLNLTFGEQVKIVLNRKGMTIKELAEHIEEQTGKKMSRQNLTQRLGRDNFQEQDMRMIADILGCTFQLNILAGEEAYEAGAEIEELKLTEKELEIARKKKKQGKTIFLTPNENLPKETEKLPEGEREITIGELVEIHGELDELEESKAETVQSDISGEYLEKAAQEETKTETKEFHVIKEYIKEPAKAADKIQDSNQENTETMQKPVEQQKVERSVRRVEVINHEEAKVIGEINPYTGMEYETNSVRMHPGRIGYVQVYDRADGKWADMTEWAFLGYQERKKNLLGKEYVAPVYLD